jgi:dihydrolipoamide dehydrogenase
LRISSVSYCKEQKIMAEKEFDVLVIGGGPGGYTAAFRAADLGLKVCLVEKQDRLGGVCLNVGCIPSKTLLHAATMLEEVEKIADYGIHFEPPRIDLEKLLQKKESVIEQLTSGLEGLCKARKIERVRGTAIFLDVSTVSVEGDGDSREISFNNVVIAAGSRPSALPGIPEDPRIWDSTAALELREIPKEFLIIGGGIIGLEMAQIYSGLGSRITIVEMLQQIIPPADKDLVQPLFLKLKKKYTILTGTRMSSITPSEAGLQVEMENDKTSQTREFDAVLVATGRKPNSEGLGLDKVGVELDERGYVRVNERQETNVGNIYAIGDIVGEPMLAHKASHEGKVAAEVIAGHSAAFSPMTIPSVAYTNPEIAWMGITEKEAKAKKLEYVKGKFPWGASGRALSADATTGVTKVLFDKQSGRIIGAGICGANGGELIHEAVLALEMGATAEDISLTVHAHPTLAETFAFGAEIVDGSITDMLPPKRR